MYGVLREIVGKWFTRKPVADGFGVVQLPAVETSSLETGDEREDHTKLWCYCGQPSFGNMVYVTTVSAPSNGSISIACKFAVRQKEKGTVLHAVSSLSSIGRDSPRTNNRHSKSFVISYVLAPASSI